MEAELKESHWSAHRKYTKISLKVAIDSFREDNNS